jgi:hypothetical protein
MLDEEIDDMIRNASNQHYPIYDDKAWDKMERLLDKHLPQTKDKEKYLLFIVLFFLVSIGLFFIFFYSNKHNSAEFVVIAQKSKLGISNTSPILDDKVQNIAAGIKKQNTQQALSAITETKIANQLVVSNTADNDLMQKKGKAKFFIKSKFKNGVFYSDASDIANSVKQDNNQNKNLNKFTINAEITDDNKLTDNLDIAKKDNQTINQLPKSIASEKTDTSINRQITASKVSKLKKKTGTSFDKNFAFTLSVGPGFSYVDLDYFGKTTFSYGAGIRYSFAKRFAVRTGFYITKKIYSADPSDYHPPQIFWTYNPNLQKIDADCQVYEIPLNVSYDFGQRKKHNWFGALGLSSYIMKQEVYDYYSKVANGQPSFTSSSTINNQNKNIFSILTLSGGYQYNITNRFSIAAEPYIELPLNGIGFGRIKLNSGGLLFTAIFKPFAH